MKFVLADQEENINTVMDKFNNSVQVAVGILVNRSLEVLMTQRALFLHQGGLWEFPGGKIEVGETSEEALKRELQEEVAIKVQETKFFVSLEHHYYDKHVRLYTYLITAYSGVPQISDGQLDMQWVSLKTWCSESYPLPEPNLILMEKLRILYSL